MKVTKQSALLFRLRWLIFLGGAPIKSWVLRACLVQGTQQLYVAALWYWGASLVQLSTTGAAIASTIIPDDVITAITVPIAVLMWAVGILLFVALPNYYRQVPGKVPSFYKSIMRRKIILVSAHLCSYS